MSSHLVIGGGRSLYIGPLERLPRHRFAANAVLVGLDDSFDLECERRERHVAAFVHGWQWHALDFHGGRAAVLFLEPGVRPERPIAAQALRRAVTTAVARDQPAAWADLFHTALQLDVRPRSVDTRIASAAQLLRSSTPTSARTVAMHVDTSTSHLEHEFRRQLGVPMGAYRQWFRMQAASALALAGHSLTELAHAAGFCDSAHFSRLFHRTFGLPPSHVFTPDLVGTVI